MELKIINFKEEVESKLCFDVELIWRNIEFLTLSHLYIFIQGIACLFIKEGYFHSVNISTILRLIKDKNGLFDIIHCCTS